MKVRITRDKEEIFGFLSQSSDLQLYLIGDLDDFFWPDTEWFVLYHNGEIKSIALLYKGMIPATFLLFNEDDIIYPTGLIRRVKLQLPDKLNVHLSPNLVQAFSRDNIIEDHGLYYRMILTKQPEIITDNNIRRLDLSDLKRLEDLYADSYPENWFDSRMLETGKYFGYFIGNTLAGVAGIHVYSAEYRIAALGNIVTRKEFRGNKIAYMLTSALCIDLKSTVDTIGLNVKADNAAAIRAYENVGFSIRASYDECYIRTR
jgi:ribosomal protein S18 acetylase RimI-like enzyme